MAEEKVVKYPHVSVRLTDGVKFEALLVMENPEWGIFAFKAKNVRGSGELVSLIPLDKIVSITMTPEDFKLLEDVEGSAGEATES